MINIRAFLAHLSKTLNDLVKLLTVVLTAGFTVVVFVSVLTRYVFNYPIIWSVEMSKLFFVWSCFLAATIAYKQQLHIRFEFTERILGPRGIKITDVGIHLLSFLFFGRVFLQSLTFIQSIWQTYFPVLNISQGWLYVSVAVSMGICLIHCLMLFVESLVAVWQKEPVC